MHVIAGMHRSGTSFLAQTLHLLGADFGPPQSLFAADIWNQQGYFENVSVVDLNNRLILGPKATVDYWLKAPENGRARFRNSMASRKWKYLFRPSPREIDRRAAAHESELTRLHAEMKGIHVKDPRFCLTLKAWAQRGEIESLVFSFRHPWAVAASIKRREGLPLWLGYQQWLYHVRSFWQHVPPDVPVFMVDFDRFFEAGAQQAAFDRLIRHMGHADPAPQRARLIEALDIRLRHHQAPPLQMPEQIARAYDSLRQLYEAGAGGQLRAGEYPGLLAEIAPDRRAA